MSKTNRGVEATRPHKKTELQTKKLPVISTCLCPLHNLIKDALNTPIVGVQIRITVGTNFTERSKGFFCPLSSTYVPT